MIDLDLPARIRIALMPTAPQAFGCKGGMSQVRRSVVARHSGAHVAAPTLAIDEFRGVPCLAQPAKSGHQIAVLGRALHLSRLELGSAKLSLRRR